MSAIFWTYRDDRFCPYIEGRKDEEVVQYVCLQGAELIHAIAKEMELGHPVPFDKQQFIAKFSAMGFCIAEL